MRLGLGLSIAQPRGRGFSPASIPNLAIWLDASDASTITKDGSDLVSQWSDKSGNGNHAVQSTAARKPTWIAAALNGLPGLRFSNQHLTIANAASLNNLSEIEIFLIHKIQTDLSGVSRYAFWNWVTSPSLRFIMQRASTNNLSTTFSTNGTNNSGLTSSKTPTAGSPRLWHLSSTSGSTSFDIDGESAVSNAAGPIYSGGNGDFTVGHSAGATSYQQDVGELRLYARKLTTNERLLNVADLKSKWGTS